MRQLFYLYKERLESLIRQLPYTDRRLDELLLRYPAMYKRRKIDCYQKSIPLKNMNLKGDLWLISMMMFMRLVEQRMEIENDRYYFIN